MSQELASDLAAFYAFCNPLQNGKYSRTDGCILQRGWKQLTLPCPICVWVFSTGFGCLLVNRTVIVLTQKRAGQLLQYIVLIFINTQIGIYEFTGPHAQVFGNARNVAIGKQRSGCFAAIGAFEAVCFFKNRFVCFVKERIYLALVFAFQAIEQLFVRLFPALGQRFNVCWINHDCWFAKLAQIGFVRFGIFGAMQSDFKVAVIGGGAAGFFAALSCKAHHPQAQVTIYEKTNKLLAKVLVSGGGRCNVTHHCHQLATLVSNYPRGGKKLKKLFGQFAVNDTIQWFESRGVTLKTEADNRMFPSSDQSSSIANCLLDETKKLGVNIETRSPINALVPVDGRFELRGREQAWMADRVIVTTGGSPKAEGLQWLKDLGHNIEAPVPSLFTFNMPKDPIRSLMGVVAPHALVRVQGNKLQADGPLLITHWGMSGPAVLRLSAFGAREFHQRNYQFEVAVRWIESWGEEDWRSFISTQLDQHPQKAVANTAPDQLPKRLWQHLLSICELEAGTTWASLSKKAKNRLINTFTNDVYQVSGKTTFKEEFVTCGGVSLDSISLSSMQSKAVPGLYFAGEVLDVDGVTGGFNFQAAWSGGFVAGQLLD